MIVSHRTPGARLFFTLRGSILPKIWREVIFCTAVAAAVTSSRGTIFEWKVTLTAVPFSIIGLALAIFLGFRNNAAYDRYWEARKLWGELVHRSRSLARQLLGLTVPGSPDAPHSPDRRATMIRRAIAFAHALRHQLRGSDPADDVRPWLSADEASLVARSRLGTDAMLRHMGADLGALVRAGELDARLAAEVDATLSAMAAVAAGCERIQGTPIPFPYTLLLHRTASLYCFLLPFGLVDTIGVMTPFVVAIVAYTFFGLDAVGGEIEEPFGLVVHHLPLNAICRTIEVNLREALGEQDLPPPVMPEDGQLD
jgi:ion channel-forming bestrophin family protein